MEGLATITWGDIIQILAFLAMGIAFFVKFNVRTGNVEVRLGAVEKNILDDPRS